jgi:hypothetical protein
MTESELLKLGFAGDVELLAAYRELIGAEPAFNPELDREWCREVMFELVTAARRVPPPRRQRRRHRSAA